MRSHLRLQFSTKKQIQSVHKVSTYFIKFIVACVPEITPQHLFWNADEKFTACAVTDGIRFGSSALILLINILFFVL
jgi:hypothetical protein